jgi:SAM-dependent methyltransferase
MRWYVKAAAQLVLSTIPGGLRINSALSRRFGEQRQPEEHVVNRLDVLLRLVRTARQHADLGRDPAVIELGTGWAPVLPVLLGLAGAETWTYDVTRLLVGENVRRTLSVLEGHAETIAAELGAPAQAIRARLSELSTGVHGVDRLLAGLGVRYAAPVDTTRLPLDDGAVQVCMSNLVLAHIPPDILPRVIHESFRVLSDGGVAVHRIRMSDEFAGGDPRVHNMNFLRYPWSFWDRFANTKIKYLNRLRCSQYKAIFADAGFELVESREAIDRQALEGIRTMKLAREFRQMAPEDLATSIMVGVWRKRG